MFPIYFLSWLVELLPVVFFASFGLVGLFMYGVDFIRWLARRNSNGTKSE